MAIIPSSTQFIGISSNVNLTEKKSSQINSETQPYTMQDIIDTAGGGGTPAGTSGQIQFNDSSAFGADSNLYWDNNDKYLKLGSTGAPGRIDFNRSSDGTRIGYILGDSASLLISNSNNASQIFLRTGGVGIGESSPTAKLHIKGTGSTSATTSLLVQNSSGTELLKVRDDGTTYVTTGLVVSSYIQTVAGLVIGSTSPRLYQFNSANANLSINTTGIVASTSGYSSSTASAVLEAVSTTQGFLPPRMTTTQKNAISTPAAGLQVYDTTLNQMSYFNGSTWVNF